MPAALPHVRVIAPIGALCVSLLRHAKVEQGNAHHHAKGEDEQRCDAVEPAGRVDDRRYDEDEYTGNPGAPAASSPVRHFAPIELVHFSHLPYQYSEPCARKAPIRHPARQRHAPQALSLRARNGDDVGHLDAAPVHDDRAKPLVDAAERPAADLVVAAIEVGDLDLVPALERGDLRRESLPLLLRQLAPLDGEEMIGFARQYLTARYRPVVTAIEQGEWLRIDRIGMRMLGKQTLSSAEYLYLKMGKILFQ